MLVRLQDSKKSRELPLYKAFGNSNGFTCPHKCPQSLAILRFECWSEFGVPMNLRGAPDKNRTLDAILNAKRFLRRAPISPMIVKVIDSLKAAKTAGTSTGMIDQCRHLRHDRMRAKSERKRRLHVSRTSPTRRWRTASNGFGEDEACNGSALLGARPLHTPRDFLVDLSLFFSLDNAETAPPHDIQIEFSLPIIYPSFVECVGDGFGVERFGRIFSHSLDRLENLVRRQSDKPFDATISYVSDRTGHPVLQCANLDDWKVAT